MEFKRGEPQGKLKKLGPVMNRRGTTVRFKPDEKIFGKGCAFKPARLLKMARSKAYLFGGVEIRWSCDPSLITDDTPAEATFHFPGGLKDYLTSEIAGQTLVTKEIFAGRIEGTNGHGSVEWAVAWIADEDGFVRSYCNTIPTPDGGTHENGLRQALSKALRAYGELTSNRRAAQVTADDVMGTAAAMLSVFIREPEFQGQTKDRLATQEATRIVESTVRDAFDHWLADSPAQATKLLEWSIDQAEERLKRKREKEIGRQSATRKLRLPGKLADCTIQAAAGTEIFIVEGDSAGGSAKSARAARNPGDPPLARQDPQRGECLIPEAGTEPAPGRPHPGARLRNRDQVSRRGPALRARHRHDRCRRRRRAYRLAAHHVLLSGDAGADRERPPLSGGATALQAHTRSRNRSTRATTNTRTRL